MFDIDPPPYFSLFLTIYLLDLFFYVPFKNRFVGMFFGMKHYLAHDKVSSSGNNTVILMSLKPLDQALHYHFSILHWAPNFISFVCN